MDYSTSHNLWDLSLPQQLPPLDDDANFLDILSKQINSNTLSSTAVVNPHNIIPFPNATPPLSEDSSPSPPAPSRGLAPQSRKDTHSRSDDMLKRKAPSVHSDDSDDDLDGPPQQKFQKDQSNKKAGSNRRKSSGGPDETRQQKRKEQNRAAQRAFRERKEKHVKDLEDQVAALEAKTSTQATENENLRDLLGRLQNENLMLKQSAFTFSFPSNTLPNSQNATNNSPQLQRPSASANSSPAVSSNQSSSPGSTSINSTTDSPATGISNLNAPSGANGTSGFTPLLSFSSLGNNNNNNANAPSSTASSNSSLPLTSFFSPPSSVGIQSPYTTIASNPLYTSYTDMSSWDQFVFGDMSGQGMDTILGISPSSQANASSSAPSSGNGRSGGGGGGGGMDDLFSATGNYGDMIPFSSFTGASPSSALNQMNGHSSNNSPSVSPVAHSTNVMSPFSQQRPGTSTSTTALPASFGQYRSSSPCGGADPDQAPLPGSMNHQPRSTMSMNGSPTDGHDVTKCPKNAGEMEAIIRSEPVATFGTVPGVVEKKPGQIAMGEVWKKLKEHPQFEEIDIDALCQELSQKARCDGSKLVMDHEEKPGQCKEMAKAILNAHKQQQQRKAAEAAANSSNDAAADHDSPMSNSSATMTNAPTPMSATSTSGFNIPSANNTQPSSATLADFPMFNPFLPMSFQQQMQNAAAAKNTVTSPLSTFGSIGSMSITQQTQKPQQTQQPQQQQHNSSDGSLPMDMPLDMGSPGSFASMMNFGPFSPSAYLSFDE